MNQEGCEFCRGELPLLGSGHRIEAWIEDGILFVHDKVAMETEKIYMQHCPVCGARWKKGVPLYKDSGFCAWGERRNDDSDNL